MGLHPKYLGNPRFPRYLRAAIPACRQAGGRINALADLLRPPLRPFGRRGVYPVLDTGGLAHPRPYGRGMALRWNKIPSNVEGKIFKGIDRETQSRLITKDCGRKSEVLCPVCAEDLAEIQIYTIHLRTSANLPHEAYRKRPECKMYLPIHSA